jgi:hypothetical protein
MYQRAWANDQRKVAVHAQGEPCRERSTKRVGTRGPYYRRWRPSGTQIDDIEKSLSVIEDKAALPLRELIAGRELEPERKGIVAQFLAVQMMRGPAFFAQREEILRPTLEGLQVEHFTPQGLAMADGDIDVARKKVIAAYLDPTERFLTMLTYAIKIASVLGLMRWQILRFPPSALAYSDHPVVLWPLKIPVSRPFQRQQLGPLETLEIRVPIGPDTAILMNWLDLSDEVNIHAPAIAAAELNAFTISQAESEWMHTSGAEPPVATGTFRPLTRLIDPSYSEQTVRRSARHARAAQFVEKARDRRFVNDVEVLVEVVRGVDITQAA